MYEEKEIKYKKRKKEKRYKPKSQKRFTTNSKKPITIPNLNLKTPDFIYKINWKQLFIRLITLILIMIILIFTISRINKNHQEKNKIINENMNKVIEATLQYYTKENVPHNIGDSTSLLLEEMINKKLIDPVIDKNGMECNTVNSYIILTKTTDKEYRLKAYLNCPKEDKTEEIIITCENKCTKNS